LVDLSQGNIRIHRNATAIGYEHVQAFASGQYLTPQTLPQLRLSSDEILG
jgi:hypothetical protein